MSVPHSRLLARADQTDSPQQAPYMLRALEVSVALLAEVLMISPPPEEPPVVHPPVMASMAVEIVLAMGKDEI